MKTSEDTITIDSAISEDWLAKMHAQLSRPEGWLAPGDKKKRGSHFDLGMIIALLFQTDQISPRNLEDFALIVELSLDGRIRPCHGVLSMVTEARNCGIKSVIVPFENRKEAGTISGINVFPVRTLQETVRFLEGKTDLPGQEEEEKPGAMQAAFSTAQNREGGDAYEANLDFADVKGQDELIETLQARRVQPRQ